MVRYFNSRVLTSLEDQKFKVSDPKTLNDPFEYSLIAHDLTNSHKTGRSSLLLSKASESIRLMSFSILERITDHSDILMWSHYADNHSGFRIHFDRGLLDHEATACLEIDYDDTIPNHPITDDTVVDRDLVSYYERYDKFYSMLNTKCECWKYEEEVRCYFTKWDTKKSDETPVESKLIDFVTLPAKTIHKIDIGINTPKENRDELIRLLGYPRLRHIHIREAYMDDLSFKIRYRDINRPHTIPWMEFSDTRRQDMYYKFFNSKTPLHQINEDQIVEESVINPYLP